MNQKLHILFLCSWYPSKVLPTNGDFIQRHAEAVSLQHQVSVLHIISDQNTQQSNIELQTIKNVKTYIGYIKYTKNPLLKLFRFYKMYKAILKKIGFFDIVHLNTLFPLGLFALHQKWRKKIPFIISEHFTGYHKRQLKNSSFIEKTISKIITKNAAFVCPVSKDLEKSMLHFGLKGNYNPIPNVVDTTIFKPSEKKENQFTIVHVSSLNDEQKNISGMLTVAKQLETKIGAFTWKFIGGTSKKFIPLIEHLQFSTADIQFINHLSQKELAAHIQTSNLFVLFSNYENLPCVILEAFSCGIPVIATDIGGISEYFPKNYGALVEKGNEGQLAQEIDKISQHFISIADAMHLYAITNFSKETIATQFSELYLKTLKTNI